MRLVTKASTRVAAGDARAECPMDSGDESVAEMGAHHHELQRVGAFMASGRNFLGLSRSSSIIDHSDVARIGWGDEVAEASGT